MKRKDIHFIWVPKCAGSSIYNALNLKRFETVPELKENKIEGDTTFGHFSLNYALKNGLVDRTYFNNAIKFAVVRNPYDRLVSLYHHYKRTFEIFPFRTFRDFAIFLPLIKIPEVGPYNTKGYNQANAQFMWLYDDKGKPLYNFLLRFENLQNDWNFMCKKLGIKAKLPFKNKSNRGFYRNYYDKQSLKIASLFYETDFKIFNYDIEKKA